MKRILVTGASGFIGRLIVPLLLEAGYEVHGFGRISSPNVSLPNFQWHSVDLFDRKSVGEAVQAIAPTHLLHLAWYAEPGLFWRSAENVKWVEASLALLRAFVEAGGRRAVFAGTCAEYKWGDAKLIENVTPCEPSTLYGVSKDATRRVSESYCLAKNVEFASGRIFFLYGPGEASGRLVGDSIRALLSGTIMETTTGEQRRDYMHVMDVARAFVTICDASVIGPVNVGSGRAMPVKDILNEIAQQVGARSLIKFGARPLAKHEPAVIEADVQILQQLGFVPRYDLRAGIANALDWWAAQKS